MYEKKIFELNNLIIYITFLLFGFNIKIIEGMYAYIVLITMHIILKFKKIKFEAKYFIITLCMVTFTALTIVAQSFSNIEYSLESFNIIIKIFTLLVVFIYFQNINYTSINYNILLILISIQIFLSIAMFHSNAISDFLIDLYQIQKYPAIGRFGGTFGKDVNSLGMLGSLIMVLAIILRKTCLVKFSTSLLVILFCLYAIVLSGMRAGLIVTIGLMILLNSKIDLINFKYIIYFIGLMAIFIYVISGFDGFMQINLNYIIERFSLSTLLADFKISSGEGNLNHMIGYYKETIGENSLSFNNYLYGLNSSLNYVDNFYTYAFLKHGIVFVVLISIISMYILFKLVMTKKYILLYLLLFTVIIALKGTFVMGNFYIFLIIFAVFSFNNRNKIESQH